MSLLEGPAGRESPLGTEPALGELSQKDTKKKRKKFSSSIPGSSGWPKNKIDMRQINWRKSNKVLITWIYRRDPEKLSHHQNGLCPHLECHLQLMTKEHVGCSGLGFQRGGRQFILKMEPSANA